MCGPIEEGIFEVPDQEWFHPGPKWPEPEPEPESVVNDAIQLPPMVIGKLGDESATPVDGLRLADGQPASPVEIVEEAREQSAWPGIQPAADADIDEHALTKR